MLNLNVGTPVFAFASILAATIACAPAVHAATHNLTTDWSDAANPNGVWTYLRAGSAFAGQAANWSGFGPAWVDSGNPGFGFSPMLLQYDGVGSEGIDAVAGDVVGHTNSGDGNSGVGELSVRFTNPVTGTAQISGKVWDAHITADRDQDWQLFINDVLQTSGTVVGDGTEGRDLAETFLLAAIGLDIGDTVELRLSRATGQVGGMLGLDMTIDVTAVPVPAAVWLLGSAFGGLGLMRRRVG